MEQICQFLGRVADVLSDYLGSLDEDLLKDNFVIVYELEEMDMESSEPELYHIISNAMRQHLPAFREQADSLTLEGVRRLLEKDLGLEMFSLDTHKRFIKQCLHECLHDFAEENTSKNLGEAKTGKPKNSESLSLEGGVANANLANERKEDASATLTGKTDENPEVELRLEETEQVVNEDIIHHAIQQRASYFKAHSETVTYLGARRLLEEDLHLNKFALDPYKNFIREKLNEVLGSVAESVSGSKANHPCEVFPNKESNKKPSKLKEKGLSLSDSDNVVNDVDAQERKEKRSNIAKQRKRKFEDKKLHETSKQGDCGLGKKSGEKQVDANSSMDSSQSSHEKYVKEKKSKSSLEYGKKIEHLKNVIRSCGIVPPSVYKRVKQAPESKQESSLFKELEDILRREGLPLNPSEKEIKDVRRKKEREKDLEGIDTSNIISGSRRTRTNFPMPLNPRDESSEDSDEGDTDNEVSDGDEKNDALHEDARLLCC
ncbi:AP-3 complex subunit mu [Nymphaea thermarum]|nr:AP-3 complex subunit mu [Nymphaea thermarum]